MDSSFNAGGERELGSNQYLTRLGPLVDARTRR
jgi:hypothetical protein